MKRDKKWLKVEIKNILRNQVAITSDGSSIYYAIEKKIDELYESEVKQLDKKIKELDSYNYELIRDNNQLRNELDNQKVLSQEWIDEYAQGDCDEWVYTEDLQNLLVPKQEEVTEKPVEAVKEYFKSVEKAKEVLEELGYVVSEKPTEPVIPQFVADYIEKWKYKGLTMYEWFSFDNNDVDEDVNKWLYNNLNQENRRREYLLIDAIRYGYEVEKEKLYNVVNKENYFMLRKYDGLVDIMRTSPSMSRDEFGKDTRFMLTEQEIKDYDKRFWAFAEEVTEN